MKRILLIAALLLAPAMAAKPLAVTTIEPYAMLARAVLGDGWRVVSLVPPGANPHVFSPSPQDVKKISGARLVVMNGLGLDEWLVDKLVKPNNLSCKVYRAADSLKDFVQKLPSGAPDPHVWTDPLAMGEVVLAIARNAAELDPQNAAAYQKRARAYRKKLAELVNETSKEIAAAPSRKFVAYKNPFSYLAARYRLERVYLITPNPAAEPSPQELAKAAALLRREGLKTIVAPLQLKREAERVAAAISARVELIDLLGESGGDYLQVWRRNSAALARALGAR